MVKNNNSSQSVPHLAHGQRKTASQWSSSLGFVIAALAGALGLGSLWKFPYIAAENGGGLFILVYLLFIVLLGIPLMVAEMVIGRASQESPILAYAVLAKRDSQPQTEQRSARKWKLFGLFGVITGILILCYYGLVAGWPIWYITALFSQEFVLTDPSKSFKIFFLDLLADPVRQYLGHMVVMLLATTVVMRGVRGGIERVSELLMAILFLILLLLLCYSFTLPTFPQAFGYVFGLHSEKFTSRSILEAAGHAFFTLSLGMGAMITYGSYLKRSENLVTTAVTVSALDTIASLICCLIVYPVTSAGGIIQPDQGPGLVFINIPIAISSLPMHNVWFGLFMILLFIAGLASAVSLLEVAVSALIDGIGLPRVSASLIAGVLITVLGAPVALPWTASPFNALSQKFFALNLFGFLDRLTSNWLLTLGALLTCIFVGYFADLEQLKQELALGSRSYGCWLATIRYVIPGIILALLVNAILG
jgi:neurotransmitter:Na+ symporter, NSS family